VPCADHVTVDPLNVPLADPETFTSPGQVALNVPLALLAVICVTVHRKSAHAPGAVTALDDVHVPASAAAPPDEGPTVRCGSDPLHAAAVQAAAKVTTRARCFFIVSTV
jgi:hypothetical protein